MSRSALWLALAAACTQAHEASLPPQSDLAARVAVAADEAWRRAGLETSPAYDDLDQFRIVRPDAAWFERACPAANGCLGWLRFDVPVAYVRPSLPESVDAHLGLHEWLHAAGRTSGRWSRHHDALGRWNPYDSLHEDAAVWAGAGGSRPGSVEQVAQRLLGTDERSMAVEACLVVPRI